MKNIIDWFPKNDPFLKKGEIDIHEIIHEHKYQADVLIYLTEWRYQVRVNDKYKKYFQ